MAYNSSIAEIREMHGFRDINARSAERENERPFFAQNRYYMEGTIFVKPRRLGRCENDSPPSRF